MSAQSWRVVLGDGSIAEVRVEFCEGRAWPFVVDGDYSGVMVAAHSARGAVTKFAGHSGWDAVEILAPGEPTRAEIAAQARREGAEAMRAEIRRALWQSWSGDQLAALAHVALPEVPR